ncbi:hypothetical protein [Dysgonomonas sp. 25]|uniref:hypothetical protein n=1 Tax=Dysgonomonas sp. 25 TaxID=2302933 RepID=UPI0013D00C12|nr:hypothetical protein [Dysgonomonas sp. 25]
MKYLFCILLLFPLGLSAQTDEYEIRITDINNDEAELSFLAINDSIFLIPDFDDLFGDKFGDYKISLNAGKHCIKGSIGKYIMIDTCINFAPPQQIIELSINMKDDFHLYEFQNGFSKVYSGGKAGTVIGLKSDSTFLMKRFIHPGYVAWFQLERGTYQIKGHILELIVTENSRSNIFEEVPHRPIYTFTIENGNIIDLDKYGNEVK